MERETHESCPNSILHAASLGRLVVNGSCLILFTIILCRWIHSRARLPITKEVLPWYTFGVALGLTSL